MSSPARESAAVDRDVQQVIADTKRHTRATNTSRRGPSVALPQEVSEEQERKRPPGSLTHRREEKIQVAFPYCSSDTQGRGRERSACK